MTPQEQIDKLSTYILENVPGEPSRSESAVDCAIRLIGDGLLVPAPDIDGYDSGGQELPAE